MTAHISEDTLERYSMDRVREPELTLVEEHLLVCEACRSRLTAFDEFVIAMKATRGELN
jgi:predicted anti-sigma-YlaC factor YlaD